MYEAVEEIYNTCIQFCKAGEYSLDDIYSIMMALTAKQLIRLGVASGSMSDKQLSQVNHSVSILVLGVVFTSSVFSEVVFSQIL